MNISDILRKGKALFKKLAGELGAELFAKFAVEWMTETGKVTGKATGEIWADRLKRKAELEKERIRLFEFLRASGADGSPRFPKLWAAHAKCMNSRPGREDAFTMFLLQVYMLPTSVEGRTQKEIEERRTALFNLLEGMTPEELAQAQTFVEEDPEKQWLKLVWWRITTWFKETTIWKKLAMVAKKLSWAYIAAIAILSILAILFAGVTLHFALEGKPGRTLVFVGITALLIGVLYTVRYPLQEAWEFATSLVGGDGTSWALQKRTMSRRIGYLAAGSLILLLVPFGEHPRLFFVALIALVMTFMLHKQKSWKTFGQIVVGACIILSFVLPGPANADSEKTEDETASTQALSDFVSGLPKAVHSGRVYTEEFDGDNLFFAEDGQGKYCRPATDPANVEDGWWLEHVYPCDSQEPTFSPTTGLAGRVLSAEEAVEYLEWRNRKSPEAKEDSPPTLSCGNAEKTWSTIITIEPQERTDKILGIPGDFLCWDVLDGCVTPIVNGSKEALDCVGSPDLSYAPRHVAFQGGDDEAVVAVWRARVNK